MVRRTSYCLSRGQGATTAIPAATAAILIADTQEVQIDKRFDLQRSSHVVLQAQTPTQAGFSDSGLSNLRSLTPVSGAGELSIWRTTASVSSGPISQPLGLPIVVADSGGLHAAGARPAQGASPGLLDASNGPDVVWLGSTAAIRRGVNPTRPTAITVDGMPYSVAGTINGAGGFAYLDSAVVMSRSLANTDFPVGETVRAVAAAQPGSAANVATYATAVLDPEQQMSLVDVTQPDGEVLPASPCRRPGCRRRSACRCSR